MSKIGIFYVYCEKSTIFVNFWSYFDNKVDFYVTNHIFDLAEVVYWIFNHFRHIEQIEICNITKFCHFWVIYHPLFGIFRNFDTGSCTKKIFSLYYFKIDHFLTDKYYYCKENYQKTSLNNKKWHVNYVTFYVNYVT